MKLLLRSTVIFLALLCQAIQARSETRCGWFDNPTAGNISLHDRDAEWIIGIQGGHQVESDWEWPNFKSREWVGTNGGSNGYGCACLDMEADQQSHHVLAIKRAWARSLKDCRRDKALPRFPKTVEKESARFSSAYTDLEKDCRPALDVQLLAEGQDMMETCKGYDGHTVSIDYSAATAIVSIDDIPGMFPEQGMAIKKRKLEWRLENGRPFAVILRIDKYTSKPVPGREPDLATGEYKVGEALRVRGLKGFEWIDFEVDVKKDAQANQTARQMTDDAYREPRGSVGPDR